MLAAVMPAYCHPGSPHRLRDSAILVCLLACVAFASRTANGQGDTTRKNRILPAGTLVRLEDTTGWHHGRVLVTSSVLATDTLQLAACAACATERFPVTSLAMLQAQSSESRSRRIATTSVLGGVLGAALGGISGSGTPLSPGGSNNAAVPDAIIGAAIGAGFGALIGAVIPANKLWRSIPLR